MSPTSQETIVTLGRTEFIVCIGDIAQYQAEVLVSSTGTGSGGERGLIPGTVTNAIRQAGGGSIFEELRAHEPLTPGDVVVTSAGTLKARYVYHAVVVGWRDEQVVLQATIWRAVSKCVALAQLMGLSSIVFPSLGTGSGRAGLWETHSTMASACLETFRTDGALRQVSFCFHKPEDSVVFRRAFYQQQLIRELRGLSVGDSASEGLGTAVGNLYRRLLAPTANIDEISNIVKRAIDSSPTAIAYYIVSNYGSGAVAVGEGARAVGQGAVMIGGDNDGHISTGENHA